MYHSQKKKKKKKKKREECIIIIPSCVDLNYVTTTMNSNGNFITS